MPEHFDLIVIGSGPAGEKGAAAAAYFGKKVALIEKEPHLGGAAANTGTLPSKTLRETALSLWGLRHRQLAGLDFQLKSRVRISDFMAQERTVQDAERFRIRENLERHGIRLFRGQAAFVDAHTVAVTPHRCEPSLLTADKFLIATGSYPFRPARLFPFTNPRIYDSDTILTLEALPESLVVVGGGVIGCEYACMFQALDVKVTIVEKRTSLLGGLDLEITEALRQAMIEMGMTIHLEDEVAEVRDSGLTRLEVELKSRAVLEAEALLVSSGRCGQTAGLNLEKIGITVNARGHIPVNEHYQTCVQNVYAAGDVIGNPSLASTAMAQGRMAVAHAFDLEFRTGLAELLPSGIYTIPECSMVGETEESLQKQGTPYVVGRASYDKNARGKIIGDSRGFLKLLFAEQDMKLLGVHVIGEQATELVHIGLTAMMMGAGADLFIHTCYNYPTLSEVYKYAAYDALGRRDARRRAREAAT